MAKENLYDELQKILNKALSKNHIPLFEGRPKREQIINNDDLLNLEIIINTSKTLDEFISKI